MEYQDQKIKAIARLTIVATAMMVLLALCLNYPDQLRNFAQHLPPRLRDKYIWLGILITMAPILLGSGPTPDIYVA